MDMVMDEVMKAAGNETAVLVKMNMRDGFRGGMDIDESLQVAKRLVEDGAQALVLSGGFVSKAPMYVMRGAMPVKTMTHYMTCWWLKWGVRMAGKMMIPTVPFKEAYFLEDALRFRKEITQIPLVYVGGLVAREKIDEVLNDGFEFVQMGRALLNEPGFVNRMKAEGMARCNCKHSNYCIARMYTLDMACHQHLKETLPASKGGRPMKKTAIITGADGGMGTEITRAVAMAGYHVIMLCYTAFRGEERRSQLILDTKNEDIEVMQVDLSSMDNIVEVAQRISAKETSVDLLMNNAGTMRTHFSQTEDGFEYTVAVNYLAPFLLTHRLLPLMHAGTRIVNMVSCTYAIGKIGPHFFTHGKEGSFWRIPIYSNTKLALWLFTRKLAEMLKDKGITVNAADPGIVSTNIISMDMWFDPLTDILFRPFIRTPRQGADTAIRLLLAPELEGVTGQMFASGKPRKLKEKYLNHPQAESLWADTEKLLHNYLSTTEKEPGRNE